MSDHRRTFHEALHRLEEQALGGLDLVVAAIDRTLEALAQRDVELASLVVLDDDRIDGRYLEVHQSLLSLLATQAPMATDLRVAASLLHVIHHIERMGDQCVNIAKVIPLDGHDAPADPELIAMIERMGRQAASLTAQARLAFSERDVALAVDLARQDDEIDRGNRAVFKRALEIGDDPDVREWAMHMILVGRALERIGDNAVDIGEQAAFVATGQFREFDDASRVATPLSDHRTPLSDPRN